MRTTGLSAAVLGLLTKVFEKYEEIEQVKLYGSRAKGTFNERSDIDLVAYGKAINRFVIADILMELDDLDIPYKVDLQNYHDLRNSELIEHINRVGMVIYDRMSLKCNHDSSADGTVQGNDKVINMSDQMDNVNFSEIVNRICTAGHPLQVVLFGSRSRGDAREDSDIDLLIIEESTEPRYKRAAKYLRALLGISPGKDVVVWTPEEVAEWASLPNTFIATALREGRVLYER